MPKGVYRKTEGHKKALSESAKGRIPWNKGRVGLWEHSKEAKKEISNALKELWQSPNFRKKTINSQIGHSVSEETRRKISKSHTGKSLSNKHRQSLSNAHMGLTPSKETRVKMSKARKGVKRPDITGENHPGWCGGISNKPYAFEFNKELKDKIRKRDSYTCQLCGKTEEELGEKLSIHHIDYNKKNCEESNLVSLCRVDNSKANFDRLDWMILFKKKRRLTI